MTEPNILYPAIFVFLMLLIGLVLTIWEFSANIITSKRSQRGKNPAGTVSQDDSSTVGSR